VEWLRIFNEKMARLQLVCAGLALIGMTILVSANVLMRVTFGSIFGTVEVAGWLAVCINALALAYSQQRREHVAITMFTDGLSLSYQRGLDALGYVAGIIFSAAASWGLYHYIINMIRSGQLSTSLSVIYWPFVAVLLIGMIGLLLVLVEDLAVAIRDIRSGQMGGSRP
jgi:TRAP-type C4-dicarboxylate transport system permease small subunit